MAKEKLELDEAITNLLSEYKDIPFLDCREDIDKNLKKLFKKYKEYKYGGYHTQLGLLNDMIIYYELKK